MDKTDILIKSIKGEEEISKRTYQLKPKPRSVLIMIDGKTSEADLLSRTAALGDVEAVLRDLEQQGFITRKRVTKNNLFDATTLHGMELRNRTIRSATWEGMCDDQGKPTNQLTSYFQSLVRGNVGLIITGYAYVRPEGKQNPGSIGANADTLAPEMKEVTRAVHNEGGKLCLLLTHWGGQASGKTIAPSGIKTAQYSSPPAEMSSQDIQDVIVAYREGARRAKEWGFDAVQIQAAHGCLINQFLSPHTNRRKDEYGGRIENRSLFLIEVYMAVRSAVGPDFPVLVKLTGSDNLSSGLMIEDAVSTASAIASHGVDAIEVTSGTPASGDQIPARPKIEKRDQEAFNLPLAVRIKKTVNCPVIVGGGLRSLDVISEIIEKGEADYVSLSRPLNREPGLVKRWQDGNTARARCISCNGCDRPGMRQGGIICVMERLGNESRGFSL